MIEKEVRLQELEQILFEFSPIGIVLIDEQGILLHLNKSICKLLGYRHDSLVGRSFSELLEPESQEVFERFLASNRFHNRQIQNDHLEVSLISEAGGIVPSRLSIQKIENDDRFDWQIFIEDESKQQRDHKRIEKSLNSEIHEFNDAKFLYQTILQNFPNGIIAMLDEQLDYVFIEGAEMHRHGIFSHEMINSAFLGSMDERETAEDARQKIMPALRGEKIDFELTVGGVSYQFFAVGLEYKSRRVNRILLVSQNISKQKITERNTQLLLQKERRLNELKSRAVSMASHEFRTPLTAISNSVSLLSKYLEREDKKEDQQRLLRRIRNSLFHLVEILNDFLSLDKLEHGKMELHFTEFDISVIAGGIIDQITEFAGNDKTIVHHHRGIQMICQDTNLIRNIFSNLLSNAVKYSDKGEVIDLKTMVIGDFLNIEVHDSGIGIPEKDQKYLFERFFRAENAMYIQGTGLGLHIVKRHIETAGGEISFISRQGIGTTFTVKLPLKMAWNVDKEQNHEEHCIDRR